MWEKEEEKEGLIDRLGGILMKFFERLHKIISGGEEEQDYWSTVPILSRYPLEHQARSQQLQLLPKEASQQQNMQPCPPCPPCPPQSSPELSTLAALQQDEKAEPQRRGRPRMGREIVCPRCGVKGIERISIRNGRKYIYAYHGLDSRKVPILHYIGPAEENPEPAHPAGSSVPEPPAEPDRQPA